MVHNQTGVWSIGDARLEGQVAAASAALRVSPGADACACLLLHVQLLLLSRSQEVVRDSQVEQHQQVQQLEAILDPKYNLASASSGLEAAGPNGGSNSTLGPAVMTISCFKPLRVAMHDKDADFMNAPVVELFNRCIWQGREYVMETCKDGQHSLSLLDPSIMANVFINMGEHLATTKKVLLAQA